MAERDVVAVYFVFFFVSFFSGVLSDIAEKVVVDVYLFFVCFGFCCCKDIFE